MKKIETNLTKNIRFVIEASDITIQTLIFEIEKYFDIINQAKDLADLSKLQTTLEKKLENEKANLDNFSNFNKDKSNIIINFIKEGNNGIY